MLCVCVVALFGLQNHAFSAFIFIPSDARTELCIDLICSMTKRPDGRVKWSSSFSLPTGDIMADITNSN